MGGIFLFRAWKKFSGVLGRRQLLSLASDVDLFSLICLIFRDLERTSFSFKVVLSFQNAAEASKPSTRSGFLQCSTRSEPNV